MGKSKVNRAKVDVAPRAHTNANCKCCACVESRSRQSNPFGHKNYQDVLDSIDYHWKTLSDPVKQFLVGRPNEVCLENLVEFWSSPQQVDCTSGTVAASLCGSSWYVALNYLRIGKLAEARALILNGAFLQQCYNTPLNDIVDMVNGRGPPNAHLRYFCAGVKATSSIQTMESFLKKAMPQEYERMMNFASKSSNGPVKEYVDFISSDWKSSSSAQPKHSKCNLSPGEDSGIDIEILMVDADSHEERKMKIGSSTTLKSLFNDYAEERGSSLRSFRFSFEGRTLFVSSAGNKTPAELGMGDLCVINVSDSTTSPSKEVTTSSVASSKAKSSKSTSRGAKKTTGKGKKKSIAAQPVVKSLYEEFKIQHSQALTRLFEEAEPKFREIRQKLNAANLERSRPKAKSKSSNSILVDQAIGNPPMEGIEGKAGKTSFIIQVGEIENLYKTSKPSSLRTPASRMPRAISIDLHGFTKEEALSKLNSSLTEWNDRAMQGSYPWVIPVEIICGGGNQILSECVETWIKKNDKVSNAPKNLILPRRYCTYANAA